MLKISLLLFVYKCNCYTVIIGTGGTSDTMHIVFTIMRNIKVYHQTNIININPPGHNISCYQNLILPDLNSCMINLFGPVQGPSASPQHLTSYFKSFCNLFHFDFRRCENDYTFWNFLRKKATNNTQFLIFITYICCLNNLFCRLGYS